MADTKLQLILQVKDELTAKINSAKKSVEGFSKEVGTNAAGATKKASSAFGDWAKKTFSLENVLKKTKWAVVAYVGAVSASTIAITNAEARMARMTGATGELRAELESTFSNVLREVPNSIHDVSLTIGELNTRLGVTGQDLESLAKQFLDYSRINNTDVQNSVRSVTRLMNSMGLEANEASMLLDKLTYAGQQSGIAVDRLSDLVTEAGPAFEELGFDVDRSIALFSQFEKVGARPEEVISSLGMALNRLANEGFTNANAAFDEYIRQIEEAPDILSATLIANELFGTRVGGKIADDIRSGKFAVDEFADALQDVQGITRRTAEETVTFGEVVAHQKNRIAVSMAELGKVVNEELGLNWQNTMGAATDVIILFNQFVGQMVKSANTSVKAVVGAFDTLRKFLTLDFRGAYENVFNAMPPFVQDKMSKAASIFRSYTADMRRAILELDGRLGDFIKRMVGVGEAAEEMGIRNTNVISTMMERARSFRDTAVERFGEVSEQLIEFGEVAEDNLAGGKGGGKAGKAMEELAKKFEKEIENIDKDLTNLVDKIDNIQNQIADVQAKFLEQEKRDRERIAKAIVDQEEKIGELRKKQRDLKKQLNKEETDSRASSIRDELDMVSKQLSEEESARDRFADRIAEFEEEMAEIKRWNSLSALEQAFEVYDRERQAAQQAYNEKMALLHAELEEVRKQANEIIHTTISTNAELHTAYMQDTANFRNELQAKVTAANQAAAQIRAAMASISSSARGGGGIAGRRATGGAVSAGQSYMVGERGAEIFTPQRSGYIIPNDKIGGGSVVVNINNGQFNNEAQAMRMADVVVQRLKLANAIT